MNNDKIVKTIRVRTKPVQDRTGAPWKPDPNKKPPIAPTSLKVDKGPMQQVELSDNNMSELDKILASTTKSNKKNFNDASNTLNNSVYKTKNAIEAQTDLLDKEVQNTSGILDSMKNFSAMLKAKVGHEMGGSSEPTILTQDDSLLTSISTSISQIEKLQIQRENSSLELNSAIQEFLEHNEDATENSIMPVDKKTTDYIDGSYREINDEKMDCSPQVIPENHPIELHLEEQNELTKEQIEHDKSEKHESNKHRMRNAKLIKIAIGALGFVSSLVGKVVSTLFRFSVSAAIAAAKWGAILFALVFGFDVISRYMKFWFNKFNTSLESFDEALGIMAPTMESLFNSFDELREYFVDGDYWSMFASVFSGLIDVLWAGLSASSVMVSKMVGGLLRKLGADETADSMEAGILKEFASQQNYRYSDADAEIIARADARTAESFIKETKKNKWSDEEAALQYQKKHGLQTNYVDPMIKERLAGLKDTYDNGGMYALTQSIKDLAKSNNRIELIEKRALQYESQSRTTEFIGEAQKLRDEIMSDPMYGGSTDLREAELKRVNDLIHNLEHRLRSIKAQEEAKLNQKEEAATKNIEHITKSVNDQQVAAQNNMENIFQKTQVITNNNSISHVPVQTSRDVPGMYRAHEVNA